MKRPVLAFALSSLLLTALPGIASAHTGTGQTSGFMHGFSHPLSGLDHVLAMVLVGVFAFQLGARAVWSVPLAFVSVMAIGGALGVAGIGMLFVEIGIALSIVVLGSIVALKVKAPVVTAMAVVGIFALFHGHAHGAEMPENAGGMAYAAGFMLATAVLHACGLGLGFTFGRFSAGYGSVLTRSAGGLAALAGVGVLLGWL